MALSLLIPSKGDEERDQVAEVCSATVGPVVRVDRFWEPPDVDRESVRVYGIDTFCLVLAQLLDLVLVSPPDDWLFTLQPNALGRVIERVALRDAPLIEFPRFVKPIIPKQFRAAVYLDSAALDVETRGLVSDTEMIEYKIVGACLKQTRPGSRTEWVRSRWCGHLLADAVTAV